MVMSTPETTEDLAPQQGSKEHHTGLLVSLAAVLAAVLGIGAGWLLFADGSPLASDEAVRAPSHTSAEVQAEATTLLNDFWAAWTNGETDQLMSLMTADGAFVDVRDCYGATVAEGGVAGCVTYHPFRAEPAVDPVILSDGPPYLAAQIVMVVMAPEGTPGGDPTSEYFTGRNELTMFVLEEEEGVLKIKEYRGL